MGIKKLKALLQRHGSLKSYEPRDDERYPAVFVDGFSVMMTMAYACSDEDEFRCAVSERVQFWRRIAEDGRLVVFLDRGEIKIKQPLRDQRRRAAKDRSGRHREFVEREEREAREREPPRDEEFAEEIRAEKQLKLQRIRFQLTLASHDTIKFLISSTLREEPVEVIYCDGVDAEMVMCAQGRAEAEGGGRWPLLVTTDQDALLFTSTDRRPKVISTVSSCHLFSPTAEAEYLCKLAALANGCDFFPGLGGVGVSPESVARAALFSEFTPRNAAVSLCTRPMRLDVAPLARAEAEAVCAFIERYAGGDEDIYDTLPPEGCCGRAFIRLALNEEWAESDLPEPTGLGAAADMIVGLPARRSPPPAEVAELERAARTARASEQLLGRVAELLGYAAVAPPAPRAEFAVSASRGLMRRLRRTEFFFNSRGVEIESEPRLLKLV